MTRRALILLVLAGAIGLGAAATARSLGIRPVRVTSGSMAPTVERGDWIVVRDLDHQGRASIARGEIVLFSFPLGTSGRAIKRVVAVGGDLVAIAAHSLTVNGRTTRLAGAPSAYAARSRVERVPSGYVFLVGDNAAASIDSRSFGAVPVRYVVARQVLTASV